ncbi:hypothetical protein, partial [Microcoleus sp.]|uniref:hypothetical protein n=1 Tax=Microcoleus sp. TaxID=44472 RepID=UPI00403EB55A
RKDNSCGMGILPGPSIDEKDFCKRSHELEDVLQVESKELDIPLKCFQSVFLFRQLTKLIFFDTFCLPISYLTDKPE